jgi:hypothetical protein
MVGNDPTQAATLGGKRMTKRKRSIKNKTNKRK